MKAAAARIERLTSVQLAQLRAGTSMMLQMEDESSFELGPDDVLIQVETKADFELETDGRFVVFFDTELDAELIREGLAREVVNRVNSLRKETGLAPEDRIELVLHGAGTDLDSALREHADFIRGETLARKLEQRAPTDADGEDHSFDLGDGRVLRVALRRSTVRD
jgi:isoleucyl-tRNA synthetase